MNRSKRSALGLFAGFLVCLSMPVADSLAQGYPDRPVQLYVGYSAGGGTDYIARLIAPKLSELLGQRVVVINLPGAAGAVATEKVAKSPADGYTLLLITVADPIVPALRTNVPYDLERDLAAVAPVAAGPLAVVVTSSLPARDVKELIALARSRPGKLNYGSSGIGGSQHLAPELFKMLANVDMVHVPYKGAMDAVVATASGQIDLFFSLLQTALPLIESGKLRVLAVTGAKRALALPSVPTLAESSPDLASYERYSWFGVSAPSGVPRSIVARLNAEINKVVNMPETRESLMKQYFEPRTSSPEEFAEFIRKEIAQNIKLVKAIGIKME